MGVTLGEDQVGAVREAVHSEGGNGGGHQLVKAAGVDVGGGGHRAPFVGGINDTEESLGDFGPDGQQANVVSDDQIAADDLADGLARVPHVMGLRWSANGWMGGYSCLGTMVPACGAVRGGVYLHAVEIFRMSAC